jgi:hypothetical protein
MRGKQIAMDAALADLDRYELEREKLETDAIMARLDGQYERADYFKMRNREYPDGSVVIIGQNLFRNGHYKWHFYRTVMTYHPVGVEACRAFFVEARTEEYPERPPWAGVVGHEDEPKSIDYYPDLIYWMTGEVTEPILPYSIREWRNFFERHNGKRSSAGN